MRSKSFVIKMIAIALLFGGAFFYVTSKASFLPLGQKIVDEMDPRQFGAVGDGITDDSEAFKQMANAGVSTIKISAGVYNLNSAEIKFNKHVNIVGSDKNECVLKNVNITAPYGISVSNLTCDGGGYRAVDIPGVHQNTTVMFYVTPDGEQSVEYNNCIFRNSAFVSLACSNSAKLKKDSATNCEFRMISIAAICHSCYSYKSTYKNNLFDGIGSQSAVKGIVAAIWIGDVTNKYSTYADYCEIDHNYFYNTYTGDDFNPDSIHVLNGNVIAVRATKADITSNTIKELSGYGHDREAIYTKVSDLKVIGNTIINGGTGEGYICNKSTVGDIKCVVSNNTIEGDYGCGICQYGTATIEGNKISIKHCKTAIFSLYRNNQTGSQPTQISNNEVNCGADGPYVYKGHSFNDYNTGSLIKIIRPINDLTVSHNTITPTGDCSAYIIVGNAAKNITFEDNIINAPGRTGRGAVLYTNSESPVLLSQKISILRNNILIGAGGNAVEIKFSEPNSNRSIMFSGNNLSFSGGSETNFALYAISGANNNDSLTISGNTSNCDKSVVFISTPFKNITNNDRSMTVDNQQAQ